MTQAIRPAKGKSPRVSVSLTAEEHRSIEALAQRLDRSASWIVAHAVRKLLADPKAAVLLGGAARDDI